MKYNSESGTSVSFLNNIGIDVDASVIYFYNNNVINVYNKNNSGITEIDENIYYTQNNNIYNLNQNGLTEILDINNQQQTRSKICGLSNEGSNIIVCNQNSVYKFDPYNYPYQINQINNNLNNPFKAIRHDDNYYISDTFNHRILKVNANTLETTSFINSLNFPRGLFCNEGNLYVVDSGIDTLINFDLKTGIQGLYSQTISGIVDLTFDSDLIYVTSLLQNIIYKIDTVNNNSLSIYLNIEKPYYIDSSVNMLVSTDLSISLITLSYSEIAVLVNNKVTNINNLLENNTLYTSNINFQSWINSQIKIANDEKNIIKQFKLYTKLEELLNIINANIEYMNISASSINSTLEDYKNKSYLTFKSFSNLTKKNIK